MTPRPLLVFAFLLGCNGGHDDPPGALEVEHEISDVVPTVVFVRWAAQGGASWVEYGLDGALDQATPPQEGPDPELTLLGLKSGRTYSYRGVTEQADGTRIHSEVATVTLAPIPQGLARFALTVPPAPEAQVADGYVMVSQIQSSGDSWVVVLDGDADVVWYTKAEPETMIVTSRPGLDGRSVLFAQYHLGQRNDVGKVIRLSFDGRTRTETRTLLAHHDFVEHADGTLAWLGYAYHPQYQVVSDVIREAPEGATASDTPTEVFNWFDATDYDVWMVCEHMPKWASDASFDEWTHSNSLMYDAATDDYYVMSKFHDTIARIRRSDGSIVWQLNGLYGDFTLPGGGPAWSGVGDTALFSHAHMSHLWDGGMVVFDNGYHYPGAAVSRAAEYVFDEAAGTVEKIWEYREPDGKFTALMGDVRKLPNGNYLIGWSSLGRLDEVTPDQRVVWQVSLGLGAVSGRTTWFEAMQP